MKTDLSNDDVVVKLGTTPHMILTTEQSPTLAGPPANARSGVAGECGRRLLLAARAGDTATLRQLIAKGAPFTADWLGTSPLHLAAQHDHVEAVAVLLRAGVSRDARTKVERTPLHLAAYAGHARVIRELLEQGAAVDARDLLRMTPLHWAVERGHIAAATALLAAGADPHAESKFHKTPMILAAAAAARGRPQMLQLLEDVIQQREKPTPEVEPNTVDDDQERASVEAAAATEAVRQTQTEPPSPGGTGAALLRRHGITLLPADDGSTVLSALQSGRTVVLSDAGRLMLKESNCQKDGVLLTATPVAAPPKGVKVFTLSSQAKVIPPRRKPAPAPPPPTPPTNPLPPTAPAQVKLVSLQSPHPGPAAVGSAVRIIMNRKNLKKLIATATRAAAIPENEVDSEGADDEESVVVVPEQFVRSSSPQYLRSQLLCAHAAIHHLSSRLRNAHAKLAQLQSSNNSSTTISPP